MLHLDVGDSLLIRCAHFEERHLGVVVGRKEGRLLVVYADLPSAALRGLRKHPVVSVRYAHESTLLGFETSLLETPRHADSLLFLAYPERERRCDQRRERRLTCHFPARVIGHGLDLPCLVRDLSAGALRIALGPTPSSQAALLFSENDELRLEFHVLDPAVRFSFRCRLLREFIADGLRYAVLLLHEQETATRAMLDAYVREVWDGPVRPESR